MVSNLHRTNMMFTCVNADFHINPEGGPNACNCILMLISGEAQKSAKEPRGISNGKVGSLGSEEKSSSV